MNLSTRSWYHMISGRRAFRRAALSSISSGSRRSASTRSYSVRMTSLYSCKVSLREKKKIKHEIANINKRHTILLLRNWSIHNVPGLKCVPGIDTSRRLELGFQVIEESGGIL